LGRGAFSGLIIDFINTSFFIYVVHFFVTGPLDSSSRQEDERLFIKRTDVIVPDNLGIKQFSENEFGYIVDWVNKVQGLCVIAHQQKKTKKLVVNYVCSVCQVSLFVQYLCMLCCYT
jgi:hypothetical protein